LIVALVAALAVVLFITIRKNKKYRLEKKKATISKVLVTGGCEGIGKEIALQFAKHLNCQIIIFDQHNEHVDDLMGRIERSGGHGHFYDCDFLDKDSVMKAIAQVTAKFGPVDILVNATGKTLEKHFEDYCHEELAAVVEANLVCPTILIKEFLTLMKKQKIGHIVHVSSETEQFHSLDNFAYCGAKNGLMRFLRSLQKSLRHSYPFIKVTVTNPHFFHSRALNHNIKAETIAYAEKIYHGVMAEKNEI